MTRDAVQSKPNIFYWMLVLRVDLNGIAARTGNTWRMPLRVLHNEISKCNAYSLIRNKKTKKEKRIYWTEKEQWKPMFQFNWDFRLFNIHYRYDLIPRLLLLLIIGIRFRIFINEMRTTTKTKEKKIFLRSFWQYLMVCNLVKALMKPLMESNCWFINIFFSSSTRCLSFKGRGYIFLFRMLNGDIILNWF